MTTRYEKYKDSLVKANKKYQKTDSYKESRRKYYEANKEKFTPKDEEKLIEYRKKYYQEHKEEKDRYSTKMPPELVKMRNREYYIKKKNEALQLALQMAETKLRGGVYNNVDNIIENMKTKCKSSNDVKKFIKKIGVDLI
jgi:hypothetical protein